MGGVDWSHLVPPWQDPLAIYAVMAVLVILIPMVCRRLKIPSLVGLLLAGMAVGPSGFGLVVRGSAIELPATLGILYIMFLAGLEIDPVQIRKQGSHSAVFGLITFFVPFGFGLAVGRLVVRLDWPSSILLASLFSSHTLLTWPAVSRFDLTRSRVSQVAVGGTIITDIMAMLVLAVIAGYAHGNLNIWFAVKLGLFVLFSVMMLTLIVPRLGRWFFRRASQDGLAEFAFVLGVLFLFSWAAEVLGLEKIIGAFLAGLALIRLIPEKSPLMGRIKFTGRALFIPLFLISTGMLIDLRHLLFTPSAWLTAGTMAAVILVSKALSSLAAGTLLGYDRKETALLFGMTVNQAAATLAAVLVGYQLKLFGEEILSGTIFMILVSCIAGSLVTEKAGRLMARTEGEKPHTYSRRPDRLAIAVAHPDAMIPLINLAILLRPSRSADPIFPIAIVPEFPDSETNVANAEKLLAQGVVHAAASGIPAIPHIRVEDSIENGILKALTDTSASVLVTGWSDNLPIYGNAFGPVIDRILSGSRQMVAVSRLKAPLNIMDRIILILPPLVDRQEGFVHAMGMVKNLAQQISGRMTVYFCENPLPGLENEIDRVLPHLPLQFVTGQKWSTLPETLQPQVRPNDLIMMFSVRFGHYAWQPRLSRLQGMLLRNFPRNNFIVWFASGEIDAAGLQTGSQGQTNPADDENFSLAENFVLVPETVSPMGMVDQLMAGGLSGLPPKIHAELRGLLIRLLLEEAVELKEGIMLIHAHTAAVSRTRVFYAARKDLSPLPGPSGMKALVVLLGPAGQSPELHLRNLSRLAQSVTEEEFRANVNKAIS